MSPPIRYVYHSILSYDTWYLKCVCGVVWCSGAYVHKLACAIAIGTANLFKNKITKISKPKKNK